MAYRGAEPAHLNTFEKVKQGEMMGKLMSLAKVAFRRVKTLADSCFFLKLISQFDEKASVPLLF